MNPCTSPRTHDTKQPRTQSHTHECMIPCSHECISLRNDECIHELTQAYERRFTICGLTISMVGALPTHRQRIENVQYFAQKIVVTSLDQMRIILATDDVD